MNNYLTKEGRFEAELAGAVGFDLFKNGKKSTMKNLLLDISDIESKSKNWS